LFALALVPALALVFARGVFAQDHGGHGGAHGAGPAHGEAASPHGEGAKAHGEGHGGHELAPFNFADFSNKETRPFVALLINFALLLFLYYRFGKEGVASALKNRRESIAKEIEEAQRIRREAAARAKEYQAKLEKLDEEMDVARKALIEAGKGEKERIVREAEEKADRMRRDAQFLLEQELKQLKVDLTRETVDVAVSAAEELLKQRVTAADHERLAEDFLTQLQAPARPPSTAPRAGGTPLAGGPGTGGAS
jgi:F-type H+-transporting ATPase subunit b